MTPFQLAHAAIEIASRFPDALIYATRDNIPDDDFPVPRNVLAVDVDRVWPDCDADAICEGAGEYRLVAWIQPSDGGVEWNPGMPKGHDD